MVLHQRFYPYLDYRIFLQKCNFLLIDDGFFVVSKVMFGGCGCWCGGDSNSHFCYDGGLFGCNRILWVDCVSDKADRKKKSCPEKYIFHIFRGRFLSI